MFRHRGQFPDENLTHFNYVDRKRHNLDRNVPFLKKELILI